MKKAKTITVLCVDDHPIVREGLLAVIATQPDMMVVDEAENGEIAIIKHRKHKPDVVLMDLRMPGQGGAETIINIREEFPSARIIVLTT